MDANDQKSYQGPGKWEAAIKEVVAQTAMWVVGFAVVWAGGAKLFDRKGTAFTEVIKSELTGSRLAWSTALMGTLSALFDGPRAFERAKNAEAQHNALVEQNRALRDQLDQTGATLYQVAEKLEKSKHTVREKAPAASHAETALENASQETSKSV